VGYRFLLWRDKLLLVSLLALFNSGSTEIRVALRSLVEGHSFLWSSYAGVTRDGAAARISGAGLYGDAEPLLVGAFAVIWLLCAGLRRPSFGFAAAFAAWATIKLAVAIWLTAQLGEDLRISMDTIGIRNAPMAWLTLPPLILTWLLSATLLFRNWNRSGSPGPAAWTSLNTTLLAAAGGALLTSWLALNFGSQHGPGDLVGVALVYVGLLSILLGLAPWERRHSASDR